MHCQQASHLTLSCPSELTFVFTTALPGPVPPPCSPQNISNFLWAFAKLGVKSPDLFIEGATADHMCSDPAAHCARRKCCLELAVACTCRMCPGCMFSRRCSLPTSQPNSPRLKCSPSHHSSHRSRPARRARHAHLHAPVHRQHDLGLCHTGAVPRRRLPAGKGGRRKWMLEPGCMLQESWSLLAANLLGRAATDMNPRRLNLVPPRRRWWGTRCACCPTSARRTCPTPPGRWPRSRSASPCACCTG